MNITVDIYILSYIKSIIIIKKQSSGIVSIGIVRYPSSGIETEV